MLRDEYYTCLPPHSPEARCLVGQLIACEWQLRLLANVELCLWEDLANASDPVDTTADAVRTGHRIFQYLQSRITATRRGFHTALKELERRPTHRGDSFQGRALVFSNCPLDTEPRERNALH